MVKPIVFSEPCNSFQTIFRFLHFRLPDDVMYFEPPQLAYWDAAKKNWRLDAFADSQYSEGKVHGHGHSWSRAFFKRIANYMKLVFILSYITVRLLQPRPPRKISCKLANENLTSEQWIFTKLIKYDKFPHYQSTTKLKLRLFCCFITQTLLANL